MILDELTEETWEIINEVMKGEPMLRGGIHIKWRFQIIATITKKFPIDTAAKANAVWYYVKMQDGIDDVRNIL